MPKTKAPEQTLEETKYLQHLVEEQTPVRVKLTSNEEFQGHVEFFDADMVRITRDGEPNLFVFKRDIKYISEETSGEPANA